VLLSDVNRDRRGANSLGNPLPAEAHRQISAIKTNETLMFTWRLARNKCEGLNIGAASALV